MRCILNDPMLIEDEIRIRPAISLILWAGKKRSAKKLSVGTLNTTLAPDTTCMTSASVCQGAACGNHPQVCVD